MRALILFFLLFSIPASADDSLHVRLLLHAKQPVGSGFGLASWVIASDIASSPPTWLALVGSRYDGVGWNVEALTGTVLDKGAEKLLVDARLELTPKLLHAPLYTWHNLEWVATGGSGALYWYSQLDWAIPKGIGLIGAETENTLSVDTADLSVGPHAALPLGDHLTIIVAPQFHFDKAGDYTGFQIWFRSVINL